MKTLAAIVGSGNIGTDLLDKLLRSDARRGRATWSASTESDGLARAREAGRGGHRRGRRLAAAPGPAAGPGLRGDLGQGARGQRAALRRGGHPAIDLTPAAVGPLVFPPVNLREHLDAPNVNMITCGGQATIPMVHAVSRVVAGAVRGDRRLGRVALGRARARGPTSTSSPRPRPRPSRAIGGAERGKAIIILNPAEPPMIMRDTVFCAIPADADTRRDRRRRSTRWSPRCSGTCPATRCAPSRSSTSRASPGRATPGSRSSSRSRATATTCRRTRATWTS